MMPCVHTGAQEHCEGGKQNMRTCFDLSSILALHACDKAYLQTAKGGAFPIKHFSRLIPMFLAIFNDNENPIRVVRVSGPEGLTYALHFVDSSESGEWYAFYGNKLAAFASACRFMVGVGSVIHNKYGNATSEVYENVETPVIQEAASAIRGTSFEIDDYSESFVGHIRIPDEYIANLCDDSFDPVLSPSCKPAEINGAVIIYKVEKAEYSLPLDPDGTAFPAYVYNYYVGTLPVLEQRKEKKGASK
jgi:hypothetical protein